MKKILLWVNLLWPFFSASGQSAPYSRVYFRPTQQEMGVLHSKGVAMDHLNRTDSGYIGEFSKEETQDILNACQKAFVLIPDLSKYFIENNLKKNPKRQGLTYTIPSGFKLGSMGGYLTMEEADSHINAMIQKYPFLISGKDSIGTSYQGRPMYAFKLSDNPGVDENEPEVLYTALHHAREPITLMQMIYFLYYALENYGKDADITNIIDHSEMYFVPFVNPDGYFHNQTTNPGGGGFWRKNRRLNADSSYGVDLNRNYGYLWGLNDNGSSPLGKSDTYRGDSAFSEPETQAISNFCNKRKFKAALNYHSFGNHLIYPWGNDQGPTTALDSTEYKDFANFLTTESFFQPGTCWQTLFYLTNGTSDDWMYGEQTDKDKIFAFTPEIGDAVTDFFWPSKDRIHTLCDITIRKNINLALTGMELEPKTDIRSYRADAFVLYPNPSSGKLSISAPAAIIHIFDSTGKLVFSASTSGEELDISMLEAGIYHCSIEQAGKASQSRKLVILR